MSSFIERINQTEYTTYDMFNHFDNYDIDYIKTNKKIEYANIPISFDIETSSFYQDNNKHAIMYIWQCNYNGYNIIGRTWDDFIIFIKNMSDTLGLNDTKRVIIYVHNLAYEFQFLRKYFNWIKVFAEDKYKPIYAINDLGIEFRCSYILTGYKLETLAKHINCCVIQKLVGNLDYNQIRTPSTLITQEEMAYNINDVRIVSAYIYDEIKRLGDITKIPLTKTGYVRNYMRSITIGGKHKTRDNWKFINLIKSLTISGVEEYQLLKRAFMGGFTHANITKVGKTQYNVGSDDLTSAYPYQMCVNYFPMSKGERVVINDKQQFKYLLNHYCCIFDIKFINLRPKLWQDNPLSYSKCWESINVILNNGRVRYADMVSTTVTELDYLIYNTYYEWDKIYIGTCYRYVKGYLPTPIIQGVLALYKNKTELKGVKGSEIEYMNSKELLNSCYGMIVTDICKEDTIYSDDSGTWYRDIPDIDDKLTKYNKSWSRFLFYPWGLYVTAHNRYTILCNAINKLGDDYIYSDTDSVKYLNVEQHQYIFNYYNKHVDDMIVKSSKYNNIDISMYKPKTIKGIEKTIGYFDYEGKSDKFKTLGAKRYIYSDNDGLHCTVAGTNKQKLSNYLSQNGLNQAFNDFINGLHIPKEETGKMTHTYIDTPIEGIVKDYNGQYYHYKELSCVHLEQVDYTLSLSSDFENLLKELEYE